MDDKKPTLSALQKCARWLSSCLALGWRRDQLDALEAIWWQHHDRNGNLIRAASIGSQVEKKSHG